MRVNVGLAHQCCPAITAVKLICCCCDCMYATDTVVTAEAMLMHCERSSSPPCTSHSFTFLSEPPVAKYCPEGLHLRALTSPSCAS